MSRNVEGEDLQTLRVAQTAGGDAAVARWNGQGRLHLADARTPLLSRLAEDPSLRVNIYGEPGAYRKAHAGFGEGAWKPRGENPALAPDAYTMPHS